MDLESLKERLSFLFNKNFSERDELGASVSIWIQGEEAISFSKGYCDKERSKKWDDSTLVPVWSATKGLAAACVLKVLESHNVNLESKVSDIWPEFSQSGKAEITFEQLLSHRAAIPAIDESVSIFDYDQVIKAIEVQCPLWEVDSIHGYHPRIFGFLLDEIVRRLENVTLGKYFHDHFALPMQLDFWIGLPEDLHSRVATLYPGKMSDPEGERDFYRAFADPQSLTRKAFGSPKGLAAVSGMNLPDALVAGWPAMGGVGTANALAKFYAMLANQGKWNGIEFVSQSVVEKISTPLVSGNDRVLCLKNSFSAGFMMENFNDNRRSLYGGSSSAFGHPGAGGSHAFGDLDHQIAFAYTMNQMNYGVLPGAKALDMVDAIYQNI